MKKLLVGLGVFAGLAVIGKVVEVAEKKEAKRIARDRLLLKHTLENIESAQERINDLQLTIVDQAEDAQCIHAVMTGTIPVRYDENNEPVYLVEDTTQERWDGGDPGFQTADDMPL